MTLTHVVPPVAASWPTGPVYARNHRVATDNARHVLEQGLKTLQATVSASLLPDVHTETLNSSVVPTLVRRIREQADDRRR